MHRLLLLLPMLCGVLLHPAHACTIFVLTDKQQTLFCNNEDWLTTRPRIWFVPAAEGRLGCAFTGFDDGWAMGGMNTAGLACDAVAAWDETWPPDLSVPNVWGNAIPQVLQTCKTVEDALAFFKSHRDPMLSMLKILVADKSGTSIIFGAKDGRLQVERVQQWRGFGFGVQTLAKELPAHHDPTVENGFRILNACVQQGIAATRYSSIYALHSGDIFLRASQGQRGEVKLSLETELARGAHYYDLPQLAAQMAQPPRPLHPGMLPHKLDAAAPAIEVEPEITARVRSILLGIASGAVKPEELTPDMGLILMAVLKQTRAQYLGYGALSTLTPVAVSTADGRRWFSYRVEYEKATLLHQFVFDAQNKLAFACILDGKAR